MIDQMTHRARLLKLGTQTKTVQLEPKPATRRVTICIDVPDEHQAEAVWVSVCDLLDNGVASLDHVTVTNRDVAIDTVKP